MFDAGKGNDFSAHPDIFMGGDDIDRVFPPAFSEPPQDEAELAELFTVTEEQLHGVKSRLMQRFGQVLPNETIQAIHGMKISDYEFLTQLANDRTVNDLKVEKAVDDYLNGMKNHLRAA